MLPSVWRRQARVNKAPENTMSEPEQHDYIAGLKKYLDSPAAPHLPEQISSVSIQCSASADGTPLTHNWRKLMPGGSARDLLFSNIQEMVRRMQREIGFEYIRFHGILSDDMRLVSRGTDRKLTFSFLFIDELLDFLCETGLKPVIEFSFMSETMAKTPQKKFVNYCTSEPRSLSEWCELVEAFINHILARYGSAAVRSWLFTPWSLPDTPINMDALDSFCYWSLSDWTGESAIPSELFFGGLGLFTKNGIPKASFYALTLLRRLGNLCIGQGPGWYATKGHIGQISGILRPGASGTASNQSVRDEAQDASCEEFQIILYNYRHFSHLYALGERFDMTFTDRYTPFSPEQSMDTDISLTDLPDGSYAVREISIGRKAGSAFDHWVSMGAVELEADELDNLEGHSRPSITKYTAETKNGVLKLDVMLEMLEVKLIMLRRVKDRQ